MRAVGVIAGSHAIFRLVKKDVALAFQCNNLLIIFNDIVVRYLCSEFGDNLAVDLDKSLLDKLVSLAARAYSGICHELVETYLLVGIGYRHLIFDTLGTGHKALALTRHTEIVLAVVVLAVTTLTVVIVVAALTVVIVTSLTVVVIASLTVVIVVTALAIVIVVAALTVDIVVTTLAVVIVVAAWRLLL